MKKLTAGIFTVMLGLVAVDANAAITSKAYVDKTFATKTTAETITASVQAETTRAKAAEEANATAITGLQKSKQDKLTQAANGGDNISIDADGKINVTGLAGADEFKTLSDSVATNTADINQIKTDQGTQNTNITANKNAIDAINNSDTGILATAKGYTDTKTGDIDTKIGEVTNGKTVVQMIADAQRAATYNDTEVRGLISTNAEGIEANKSAIDAINNVNTGILAQAKSDATTKSDKALADAKAYANGLADNYATAEQGKLAQTALQKYGDLTAGNLVTTNPGGEIIDAGRKGALAAKDTVAEADIDAAAVVTAKIADKNVTKEKLDDTVRASLNKADAAIPMVATNNSDGVYVLTATALDGNVTYAWENITREGAVVE